MEVKKLLTPWKTKFQVRSQQAGSEYHMGDAGEKIRIVWPAYGVRRIG